MRPVLQRHLMDDVPKGEAEAAVNAGHVAGDCIRACVATIMGAELDQVPHFVQYIEHPEGTDTHLWYWALLGFCHASGWRVEWSEDKPDGWSMVEGRSPRGHMHVVVAYDGEIVHDPHPSGGGLVDIQGYYAFSQPPTPAASGPGRAVVKGVEHGLDHPRWEDGTPILVGDIVSAQWDDYELIAYGAIVHSVACDELTIGGTTADGDDWTEQVPAEALTFIEHSQCGCAACAPEPPPATRCEGGEHGR